MAAFVADGYATTQTEHGEGDQAAPAIGASYPVASNEGLPCAAHGKPTTPTHVDGPSQP